jgi:lysozyme
MAILVFLFMEGIFQFNRPDRNRFPVRGVDVSHHQGEINWPELAAQDVHFAYIKATEGGDFKDTRFAANWREAKAAGLAVGAYHFFLSGKNGRDQALNFIASVPIDPNALPPVLDVECPAIPPGPALESIRARIRECLETMEVHYTKIPVIYTTYEAYTAYVKDNFERYPLWIRSVFTFPDETVLGRGWHIWQYAARGRLNGYSGRERFIDLNVFNGTPADFTKFRQSLPAASQ